MLLAVLLRAQTEPNSDFLFINHLTAGHKYAEAVYLIKNDTHKFGNDTANYLLGYNYHFQKRPDTSAQYFSLVSQASPFYTGARFFESLNLLYAKQKHTHRVLEAFLPDTAARYRQMYYLVKGANLLIERNYAAFDSVAAGFAYDNFNYAQEQRALLDIRNQLKRVKRKSPAVAGLLSAVVPGLGKFYAGKKGAGMSAFFMNMVLAGMAYENYYRSGYKSPQFIFFGTIFGFFYAGNIVGSVYSVKQHVRSFNGKLNNEITATVHIPVHRLFAK